MDLALNQLKVVPQINCGRCGHTIETSSVSPLATIECPQCGEPATVPAEMGNLLLVQILGKGTSGIVCKALNDQLHRQVAVKLLIRSLDEGKELVDQCINEARALARVNHRNVVQIYSVGEFEGLPFIEMELVIGGSLKDLILDGQHVAESRALEIAIQVAEGLQAAYATGLIHRDVKPANVLLDRHGQAKLLDFGMAHAMIQGRDERKIGTPFYVAPEVLLGKTIDFRSDICSLGSTLFHLLTGRPPFVGKRSKEVIQLRVTKHPPGLLEVKPELHESTAAVVKRMIAFDPEKRYGNYEDLVSDLRGALAEVERDEARRTRRAAGAASGRVRKGRAVGRKGRGGKGFDATLMAVVIAAGVLAVGLIGLLIWLTVGR